ncbi:MarR family winged helix-turn-helix transcriptional regulator [Trueperella pecoris]|uniref:MarR family transcriptional regulator n=1 Tax=Trueperella pecoris TaxID=2733571 RepID=A0A7M1QV78_9ACTO|nr:MarR family transcriptional regulator [Trueperella pecoris]QOQ39316.1 MarR family transcriptional regulator [Trueperella pecoris]QOR46042.1 MarR family transcriptional regulator [Trueperella pecoris]QTG75874.1 MarR family transcriptional regulator [Trueperella pecoris]
MANWLSQPEQEAWRSFLTGQATILDKVNQDMANDSGLTLNEYEVLVRLSESEDRKLRMSNLAENLVHSRSRLTHTVKRLEQAGFVRREPCPHDRRGIICQLTNEGYAKLEEAAPKHVDSVRRHFVDLLETPEFLELGRAFRKVIDSATEE